MMPFNVFAEGVVLGEISSLYLFTGVR